MWLGTACDGKDSDLCQEGIFECASGAQSCTDISADDLEICDGQDNDCDNEIDEGVTSTYYRDADKDGYGNPDNTIQNCSVPEGYVNNYSDCDDSDDMIHPSAPEVCDGSGIIVPAYFYPTWWDSSINLWDDLARAASQVPIIAIMNPNSGPGDSQNSDYVHEVDALRIVGGKVIGYIHTSYGARDIATCKTEVDNYYSWYNIDGIFFDEMSNLPEDVAYYDELYNYVVNRGGIVVGNPGTNTIEAYIDAANILNIFENNSSEYPGWIPDSWINNYIPSSFSNVIYGVLDQSKMKDYIKLARSKNVGWIYITDDILPNPWDTLSSYWAQEIKLCSMDNDCDSNTPDGMDEQWFGAVCDGGDLDLCEEGIYECVVGGVQACSDLTDDDIEVCDGVDNDCDDYTDEGGDALCDDSNPCNGVEICDGEKGCQPGTLPEAGAISCDDNNACITDDMCDGLGGCSGTTTISCDDGDACNGTETCEPQSGCIAGTALNCDDKDDCTSDSCDSIKGCAYIPIPGCGEECLYPGDINDDKVVNMTDVNIFRGCIGASDGDINFNKCADLDNDGRITMNDYKILRSLYGKTY